MFIKTATPIDRYDTTAANPQITTPRPEDMAIPALTPDEIAGAWDIGAARPLTWEVPDASPDSAIVRVTTDEGDELDYLITYVGRGDGFPL